MGGTAGGRGGGRRCVGQVVLSCLRGTVRRGVLVDGHLSFSFALISFINIPLTTFPSHSRASPSAFLSCFTWNSLLCFFSLIPSLRINSQSTLSSCMRISFFCPWWVSERRVYGAVSFGLFLLFSFYSSRPFFRHADRHFLSSDLTWSDWSFIGRFSSFVSSWAISLRVDKHFPLSSRALLSSLLSSLLWYYSSWPFSLHVNKHLTLFFCNGTWAPVLWFLLWYSSLFFSFSLTR